MAAWLLHSVASRCIWSHTERSWLVMHCILHYIPRNFSMTAYEQCWPSQARQCATRAPHQGFPVSGNLSVPLPGVSFIWEGAEHPSHLSFLSTGFLHIFKTCCRITGPQDRTWAIRNDISHQSRYLSWTPVLSRNHFLISVWFFVYPLCTC